MWFNITRRIVYKGIKTRYFVTTEGEVYNDKGHKMKLRMNQDGYMVLKIFVDGKAVYPGVHVLVATAFIPNPNNLPQVNHIDGDKTNNCVINLEWVTVEENIRHAILTGLRGNITVDTVEEICRAMESGEYTQNELVKIFNVPRHTIAGIKNRVVWTFVSDKYKVENCKLEDYTTPIPVVKKICELIVDNRLSLVDIADSVGVTPIVVFDIYRGRNWKRISKNYDFSGYTQSTKGVHSHRTNSVSQNQLKNVG